MIMPNDPLFMDYVIYYESFPRIKSENGIDKIIFPKTFADWKKEKKREIDEKIYEEIKNAVWIEGIEAIDDLLGYEHNINEDSAVTESRMDEVLDQMPKEEIMLFYEKYCNKEQNEEREDI